ncbi:MAG: hypothetical protein ACOC9W_04165 [Persicimonas sp.]
MSDDPRRSPPHAADSTLPEPRGADGTVELSADDIEPVEPCGAHAETTQVMKRERIQLQAFPDAQAQSRTLRTTAETGEVSEQTTNYDVPAELIRKMAADDDDDSKTSKMKSVTTRPMPRVEANASIERSSSGSGAEPDGFYTFVALPDSAGRIQLPKQVLQEVGEARGSQVIVEVRVYGPSTS